jgi:pimeloyl-ACP methyl ester carboxylesterase
MNGTLINSFLDLPNQRTHVVEWSGRANASTILLVHGLASNAKMWNLVAPKLARTFHVVALDQRSHGLTPVPADNDFGFSAVCEDMHLVCKELGITRPVVVGHSWGGNVALEYATRYADSVAGVVMIDGGYLSLREVMTWSQVEKMMAPPRWAGKPLADFLLHAERIWAGNSALRLWTRSWVISTYFPIKQLCRTSRSIIS